MELETSDSAPAIDPGALTRFVRSALRDERAEIMQWDIHSLRDRATAPMSGGLYRFTGDSMVADARVSWSLILKVVRPWPDCTPESFPRGWDPADLCYWQREPLAYASDLLPRDGPGLRALRCFGVAERPDGVAWIALEDVADRYPAGWPRERYQLSRAAAVDQHVTALHGGSAAYAHLIGAVCGRGHPRA